MEYLSWHGGLPSFGGTCLRGVIDTSPVGGGSNQLANLAIAAIVKISKFCKCYSALENVGSLDIFMVVKLTTKGVSSLDIPTPLANTVLSHHFSKP